MFSQFRVNCNVCYGLWTLAVLSFLNGPTCGVGGDVVECRFTNGGVYK